MARSYAKLLISLNDDDDWWALTPMARDLYTTLLIDPKLSHCGVGDWRPARIAGRCAHWSTATIKDAAAELVQANFIVIDEDSEEVLVRTFVRNDGVLTGNPKGATPVLKAIRSIGSRALSAVTLAEARRLHQEQPGLPCWKHSNGGSDLVKLLTKPVENADVVPSHTAADRRSSTQSIADGIEVGIEDTNADRVGTASANDNPPDPLAPSTCHLTPSNLTPEERITTTSSSATASPTEDTSKSGPPRPEIQRLCDLLSDLVAERGSRRPKASAQYDPCRLMLDRDHRTAEQIEWLIRWSQADPFWHQNIRSMAKLREQWDTLRLKATANRATPAAVRRDRPRGSAFGMGWQADTTDRSAS